MDINKSLKHFEWKLVEKKEGKMKLKDNFKPTKNDLIALNSIIEWKQLQEQKTLQENQSFAKLWIHQIILLSNTNMYNGERAIQVVDEILNDSVYNWCLKLKEQIPMMRFNSIALDKYPLGCVFNNDEQKERNKKITEEFETELTKEFKFKISEENIIKFVENQVNRCINKFDK